MNPQEPKTLHTTRWLHLLEREGWTYASRRAPTEPMRTDAVNVIAIHEEAGRCRLVVIEEYRRSIAAWDLGLPAGLVERGEDLHESAVRELVEETGLVVTWRGAASGRLFASTGLSDESLAYVLLGCSGTPAHAPGVDGEQIRVHLLDRDGCRDLLRRSDSGTPLSGRLWPFLFAIAETGRMAGREIA